MLLFVRMRIALVFAALLATGSIASAGTFIGLGIGTAPSVSDSNDAPYASDGRSARLAVGYAFELKTGRLAVEGAYSGFGYTRLNAPRSGQFDPRTQQVAGK